MLICTFPSLDAISIIKRNAKKLPRHVKFCPRAAPQYTTTMNDFLKTQGQIRLLKDTNGIPLAKSRITTNKGHLVLEKSDRVGESFSRFYPIKSFIPQPTEDTPSTTTLPYPKTHTLIQCKWEYPIEPRAQNSIKEHLKHANFEYAFFNRTSHLLNITTRIEDTSQTLGNTNTATILSNTF